MSILGWGYDRKKIINYTGHMQVNYILLLVGSYLKSIPVAPPVAVERVLKYTMERPEVMSPDLVTFTVTISALSRTVMLTGDKETCGTAWEEEKFPKLGAVSCVFNLSA